MVKGWGFPYESWPQELKDEYAYNPALAKKLLAEAGYPTGFKTMSFADTVSDMPLLKIVQGYFADIGIEMEIRTMDPAAWIKYVEIGTNTISWCTGLTVRSVRLTPPCGDYPFPHRLFGHFCNISDPVFDSYYPKALAAKNDDELKPVLKNANERVARQHWAVIIAAADAVSLLCQPWLKGFKCSVARHLEWAPAAPACSVSMPPVLD